LLQPSLKHNFAVDFWQEGYSVAGHNMKRDDQLVISFCIYFL
jgi:hypothetical protein